MLVPLWGEPITYDLDEGAFPCRARLWLSHLSSPCSYTIHRCHSFKGCWLLRRSVQSAKWLGQHFSLNLQNRLFSLGGAKAGFGLCGAWKPCVWKSGGPPSGCPIWHQFLLPAEPEDSVTGLSQQVVVGHVSGLRSQLLACSPYL